MRWDALPKDVTAYILLLRRTAMRRTPSALAIQSSFRRHRVRHLVAQYQTLRYLHEFRRWNPSLSAFLTRSRT